MEPKHSWGEPTRELHETTRVCAHCGLKRITVHEGEHPWTEYRRGAERAPTAGPCAIVLERELAQ